MIRELYLEGPHGARIYLAAQILDLEFSCVMNVTDISMELAHFIKSEAILMRHERGGMMSVPYSLMLGIVIGVVLFIVLERTGVVYRWFDRWDHFGE
jgi:hypothetical protein